MTTYNNSNLSTYLTIKYALMASGYAAKDAGVIAKRLSKRKHPIEAMNEEYLSIGRRIARDISKPAQKGKA